MFTYCSFFFYVLCPLLQTFPLWLSGLWLPHLSGCFYYFYLFFTAIKYLLTLFLLHKATAIYTPIDAKAWGCWNEFAGGTAGLIRAVTDQIYKSPLDNLPSIQLLKGSRFDSTWNQSSEDASLFLASSPFKKKKALAFCTQSRHCACLGCCQQHRAEIYGLVLKSARVFDPCNVIFFVSGIWHRLPHFIPGKKREKSLTQSFWTGKNGQRERERERNSERYREHEWALYSFLRA